MTGLRSDCRTRLLSEVRIRPATARELVPVAFDGFPPLNAPHVVAMLLL